MSTSPTFAKTPDAIASVSNSPSPQITMTFYKAIEAIGTQNAKVTRLEWNDTQYYAAIRRGYLVLHKPDGNFYAWTITEADVVGTDYVILQPAAD
jgi:succinylglutamate desuccinylase